MGVVKGAISIADNATAVLKSIKQEQTSFRNDVEKTKAELTRTWDKQYKAKIEATSAMKKMKELKTRLEPLRNGAYARAVPTESVKNAVSQALEGVDFSKDALFFRGTKELGGSWHATALEYLFTHKGHAFFK